MGSSSRWRDRTTRGTFSRCRETPTLGRYNRPSEAHIRSREIFMLGHRDAVGLLLSVVLLMPQSAARGDEFDRLGGGALAALLRDAQTRTHPALGFRELEALPPVLRDSALRSVDREDRPGQPCATAGFARVPQAARRQRATGPTLARGAA